MLHKQSIGCLEVTPKQYDDFQAYSHERVLVVDVALVLNTVGPDDGHEDIRLLCEQAQELGIDELIVFTNEGKI